MVAITNKPLCKTINCKRELTYLEDSKCWRCLICNPVPSTAPKQEEEKTKSPIPVPHEVSEMIESKLAEQVEVGEERIREIVRDELENWHIQKPPVTKDEIADVTGEPENLATLTPFAAARKSNPDYDPLLDAPPKAMFEETKINWRAEAKALGIKTFQRKKVDVLAEIAEKTK